MFGIVTPGADTTWRDEHEIDQANTWLADGITQRVFALLVRYPNFFSILSLSLSTSQLATGRTRTRRVHAPYVYALLDFQHKFLQAWIGR
jgi:hypothetical protein